MLIDPTLEDPTWGAGKLIPVAEHTFRLETEDGTSNHGERVVFEMEKEQVHKVQVGENYMYPQAEW